MKQSNDDFNVNLIISKEHHLSYSLRLDPSCGWCDNGDGTGVGVCRVGGAKGPLTPEKKGHHGYGNVQKWVAADTCRDEGKSWHFTSCPGNTKFLNFI